MDHHRPRGAAARDHTHWRGERRKAGNASFKGTSAPNTAGERDRKRINTGARQGEKRRQSGEVEQTDSEMD